MEGFGFTTGLSLSLMQRNAMRGLFYMDDRVIVYGHVQSVLSLGVDPTVSVLRFL